MHRLLLPLCVLVLTASIALASLPCKTRQEALAEAVVGFFLVQRIAAARCDEHTASTEWSALHTRIGKAHESQASSATTVRAKYFQRAYGDTWRKELKRVDALMTDLLSTTLAVSDENCGKLKDEFSRRLAGGWEPILDRLTRRIDGIAQHDQNICKP